MRTRTAACANSRDTKRESGKEKPPGWSCNACRQKAYRHRHKKVAAPILCVVPISRLAREVSERKAAEGAGHLRW